MRSRVVELEGGLGQATEARGRLLVRVLLMRRQNWKVHNADVWCGGPSYTAPILSDPLEV